MTRTRTVALGEMTEEQRRVYQAGQALHRDGATPAGALELLAAIIEDRTWERVSDESGRPFAGRFREFVTDKTWGLNTTPTELTKVIELRHPRESKPDVAKRIGGMRAEIGRLLRGEIEPAAPSGGDMVSSHRASSPERVSATHPLERPTPISKARDATAITARLKRDDPELAERVVKGEITANAAARAKGWRHPRIVVSTPERVAVHLRKYLTPEQRQTLARLLTEE